MRSKSAYALMLAVGILIFGIATDQASSNKLSSLAVSAFDGAVGTAIELVKPSSAGKMASQRSANVGSPPGVPSISQLQPPALAEARTIETIGPEATPLELSAATEPDVEKKADEDAQRRADTFSGRFSEARSSFKGGALGGAGRPAEGATEEQAAGPAEVTASADTVAAVSQLMDLVVSDLDRDYGAHSVGSDLDFTTPAKPAARSESPNSSSSPTAQPSSSPETGQPAATNPSPIPSPIFDEPAPFSPAPGGAPGDVFNPVPASQPPAASSTNPGIGPPTNNPSDALDLPVPPFDDVVDLGGNGFPPAPGGPPTDVDDFLILPSNIAPPGLVAPTPAEVQFGTETPTVLNPEPASLVLFGTGLAFVARRARKRFRA